jgi:hypothetical protein
MELARSVNKFDPDLLKEVDEILNEIEQEDESYTYNLLDSTTSMTTILNHNTMQPYSSMRESTSIVEFVPTNMN